ncbi:Tetratricopeptide repeat protein [Planctomycetes bacterium CA13]|uniref:Tetratricopeptide repeat protein n=2 Tax=Novipirellula herctigrandis TaxID=2527986 RepID=A0A5C5Z700_9BACT|nr:Tetratricopeptide repeat protein [Planctomycetes bacterium CA13]
MEQAVRLSANDPKRVQRLGQMYLDVGRLEEAQQQSEIALAAARGSADVWALRGDCLLAANQLSDALAAYHRALAIQPDYPELQLQAAEIYHMQERHGRLLATLDRLQDGLGPEATPARADILQGIAMREVGRLDEAKRSFIRAAGKDPNDATPHLELASLSLEHGNVDQAKTSLATALMLNPNSLLEGDWSDRFKRQQERLADQQKLGDSPIELR